MNIAKAIEVTFSNTAIVSSITSTIFIILLGFYLRKRGIFTEQFGKILSKIVLTVALPALAFNSFMQPINDETLSQGMNVLIWGIAIYIILILLTPILYTKYSQEKRDVLSVLTTFGSTTFFGIPIVGAVFGPKGIMYSSIFNIGYRIFLYSYAYIKMSGLKMKASNLKKMFVNPVVLATFLGLIMWVAQNYVPQVAVKQAVKGVINANAPIIHVAFYRIDQTAIWLYKPMQYLANLASPLAWLSIGSTLGSTSFKKAAANKASWYYSFNKVILVPLLNLAFLVILNVTKILPVSYVALGTIIIMMATPAAAVATSYAISFDREPVLSSNASFVSTILAVVAIPLWIAVIGVLSQVGLFH